MITIYVKGQSVKLSQPVVVANSIDFLEARVIFQSADWADLTKWIHFRQGGASHKIMLTGGRVQKSDHLNLTSGEWKVMLTGNDLAGTMRITTEEADLTVKPTGCTDEPLGEIGLSVAEQVSAIAARAEKTAQSVRDDADAGKFDGGYYSVTATAQGNKLTLTFTASKPGMAPVPPQTVTLPGADVDPAAIAQAVEEYFRQNPIEVPQVPDWAMKPEKPEYTAQEVGALSADSLPAAVNAALEQAKASGVFNGEDGFSPVVNLRTDSDGVTVTVTDKTGSKSAKVKNGKDGEDGKTPVKGVDYDTPQDRKEIAEAAAKLVPPADTPTAAEVSATVPAGLPPETAKNAQAVLDALAARPAGGGTIAGLDLGITGAEVGQYIEVLSVNEAGQPTGWRAVPKPAGGGGGLKPWRLIGTGTAVGTWGKVEFTTDLEGKPLHLRDVIFGVSKNLGGRKYVNINGAKNGSVSGGDWMMTYISGTAGLLTADDASWVHSFYRNAPDGIIDKNVGLEFADAKEGVEVTIYGRDA